MRSRWRCVPAPRRSARASSTRRARARRSRRRPSPPATPVLRRLRPRAAPPNSPPASNSSPTTATLSDVAQEWLLDRGLHALARIEPSPAARATVTRLSSRAPTVYARVDPDHGERATPLYDAGATARFVLRSWERHAARATAQHDLARRSTRAVARFSDCGVGPRAFRHRRCISRRTDPGGRRAAARRRRRAGAGPACRCARADRRRAARRPRTLRPARRLRRRARRPWRRWPRPGARSIQAPSFETLVRASRRADIASAAVLEAGRLAADDAAARRFLFEALADPGIAPSAAAALAALRRSGRERRDRATAVASARRRGSGACWCSRSASMEAPPRAPSSTASRARGPARRNCRRRPAGGSSDEPRDPRRAAPRRRAACRRRLHFRQRRRDHESLRPGLRRRALHLHRRRQLGHQHRARLSAARAGRLDDAGRGLSRLCLALRAAPVAARAQRRGGRRSGRRDARGARDLGLRHRRCRCGHRGGIRRTGRARERRHSRARMADARSRDRGVRSPRRRQGGRRPACSTWSRT